MINGSKESPKKFLAKASSSSRPKTSLPVTGNLAMEIFLGLGLFGGLRVPTREAVGGPFSKL
jgi:hypothetical protein